MDYVDFGRTGLKVSVAGLGCGGNSKLGLGRGKSEAEALKVVRAAFDMGVNFFDTAAVYGTEDVVGLAAQEIGRERMVISTKSLIRSGGELITPQQLAENLDTSLGRLRTDVADVYNLHAVAPTDYDYARNELAPVLQKAKAAGKIRHIAITETSPRDPDQKMLQVALKDPIWEAAMLAFHMMHQGARENVFPLSRAGGVGTMLMFVVRNIFSQPDVLRDNIKALAAKGNVPAELALDAEPLDFLVHETGAESILDAAYRFARHEPGADVVLFGTSDVVHLKDNIASILRPPLPEADRDRLQQLFGRLSGVGLDLPGPPSRGA
ncbi:MAG: aryl-alcohol dehydrogenase-like predicted oxidoreductase [Hyphomicrobiaceae bacterium]|jgi:aryl-alcohol dehydrogenase-like predicted oxidoreductase